VAAALQDAEVLLPWTHGVRVLVRHHARDLVQVGQIVCSPRREQLGQRHGAERRMPGLAIEIVGLEVEIVERAQALGSKLCELVQELRQ